MPPQGAKGTTLRGQVMELIDEVLSDPDPDSEWVKSLLRKHLASHPDSPEHALLEHLIETRNPAAPESSRPAPRASGVPGSHGAQYRLSSQSPDVTTKRIQAVLGRGCC